MSAFWMQKFYFKMYPFSIKNVNFNSKKNWLIVSSVLILCQKLFRYNFGEASYNYIHILPKIFNKP